MYVKQRIRSTDQIIKIPHKDNDRNIYGSLLEFCKHVGAKLPGISDQRSATSKKKADTLISYTGDKYDFNFPEKSW